MKRREFIGITAASATLSFFQAHTVLAEGSSSNEAILGKPHLIESIRLQTTTSLQTMKKFY